MAIKKRKFVLLALFGLTAACYGWAGWSVAGSRLPRRAAGPVALVSAASFALNGPLTAQSNGALFGTGLAPSTLTAPGLPLPTTLGIVRVQVRDAAGATRDASLFFVAPTQINLMVPAGTANGVAALTVFNNSTPVGEGTVNIETVAPGLFSANANGAGVAAAIVQRVKANGQTSFESVFQSVVGTNRFTAIPIDLGDATDRVFLIFFGTGFRRISSLSAASATLGGAPTTLSFLGAQGQLAGLDQGNLLIPRSLVGRGSVDLALTVEGKRANTVSVTIK